MTAAGLRTSPRDVECPRCRASEGDSCYEAKRNLRQYHQERWVAFREATVARHALAEQIAEDVRVYGQAFVRWTAEGQERIDPRLVRIMLRVVEEPTVDEMPPW